MKEISYATCSLCEATCGIVVESDRGVVTSIRGDKDDPFSRGYICPKAMALKDLHEDPDRLRTPLVRRGESWQPISWEDAFDETAARMQEIQARHGKNALAVYQGNPTVHSLGAMTYGQIFQRSFRTRNRYSATSADQLPHMLAALLMFGHQLSLPIPDVDRTQFMLILGANPLVSNGSIMTAPGMKQRLAALRQRGGKLVVVDPRYTETAAVADRHHFIVPGTDALLLLAMIDAIFSASRASLGALESNLRGLESLREAASLFPAEEVAPAVGIAAPEIRALALEFASAPRAVCYGRVGLCTQEFGGLAAWLVNALNAITGNLDREGGAMFPTPAVDLPGLLARRGHRGGFARFRSRVRGLPEFGGELPVSVLAEEIDTPGDGQIRGLVTCAGNPVLSTPNGARLDAALESLEFMVAIDFYVNETTRHAHIILPPTMALERDHYDLVFSFLSVRNVAKYARAVFERGSEQRHDWEIFLELTARLKSRTLLSRAVAPLAKVAAKKLGPSALVALLLRMSPGPTTIRDLRRHPHGLDLGPLQPRLAKVVHTGDGRVDLAPEPYLEDLDRLDRHARALRSGRGVVLIGRRHLRSNNSWLHNSLRLIKGKERCTLLIHPQDAAEIGAGDGDPVRVTSRVGSVVAPAEVSDDIMRGVVSLPHGWGHTSPDVRLSVASAHAGISCNNVTDERLVDALSGNASFSGVLVSLELASPTPSPA